MNTGRKRTDLSIKLQKNPTKLSNDTRQEKTTAMRVRDKAIHPHYSFATDEEHSIKKTGERAKRAGKETLISVSRLREPKMTS